MTHLAPDVCADCGTHLAGRWCHTCGQKRIEPQERRFSYLARQFFREVTMIDGRIARAFARLLFRPGLLGREWIAGRRRRHVPPVTLFLLANLIYFFHPPLSDLNLSLVEQTNHAVYGAVVATLVEARLAARGVTAAEYATMYSQQATTLAKLTVVLHVPLSAAVLLLLHARRRIYYVDHIAVALHFWAFMLLHMMATPLLLGLLHDGTGSRAGFQVAMLLPVLLYAWRQLSVAYAQPGWLAAAKLPLFMAGVLVSHLLYRFTQFMVAFATT